MPNTNITDLIELINTAHIEASRLDFIMWAGTSKGARGTRACFAYETPSQIEIATEDLREIINTIREAIELFDQNLSQ